MVNPNQPTVAQPSLYLYEHSRALLSLDETKIRKSCRKWGIIISADASEFWASVHRAIVFLPCIAEADKVISKKYLSDNKISLHSKIALAL